MAKCHFMKQNSINHLESVVNHSFEILSCRKLVDLSNEVLSILVSQESDKLPDVKVRCYLVSQCSRVATLDFFSNLKL